MSAPSAINNQREIIVGNTPSTNTITTGDLGSAAFQAATNAGEIGIFTPEGVRMTEATAATEDRFVIAVSRGTDAPIVSDVIVKSTMANTVRKVYAAATEQSLAIGYNGTSGSILDTATYAGELYTLKMIIHQFLSGTDDERIKRGDYKSLSTDGQAEVALGVVGSLNKNMAREVKNSSGNPPVVAKAICNEAASATNDLTNNATVTQFSDTFAVATALTYNGTSGTLVVGDYIRFSAALNGTLALTDSVYKVTSISGLNVTVDRPIIEPSGTWTDAGDGTQVIPAADGQAADWGIVVTGQELPWNASKKKYAKVRMDVQPNDSFGSTVVSTLSNASEGTGTYEQVAELENFLQGYNGEQYEMGEPNLFDSSGLRLATSAVTGGGYDLISFSHTDTKTNLQSTVAKKEIILATPATAPDYMVSTGTTQVTDVLEVLAGLTAGSLAV